MLIYLPNNNEAPLRETGFGTSRTPSPTIGIVWGGVGNALYAFRCRGEHTGSPLHRCQLTIRNGGVSIDCHDNVGTSLAGVHRYGGRGRQEQSPCPTEGLRKMNVGVDAYIDPIGGTVKHVPYIKIRNDRA